MFSRAPNFSASILLLHRHPHRDGEGDELVCRSRRPAIHPRRVGGAPGARGDPHLHRACWLAIYPRWVGSTSRAKGIHTLVDFIAWRFILDERRRAGSEVDPHVRRSRRPVFVLSEGCANPRVYPCVVLAARRFVLDGAPEWGVTPACQYRDSSSTSGGTTMRGMTPRGGLHSSGESKVLHHRQGWKGLELALLSRSRLW